MKLNRDNFLKQSYDGGTLYQYVCNDTNFFLYVNGQGSLRKISIFKGNVDAPIDAFQTFDSLEAWNKFEEMLTECQPEQTTSGGFKNNPQQNPNILPLLAIRKGTSGWDVVLFVEYENQQIDVMNFQVTESALPNPLPEDLTVVNWTNEEIPTILKCEVIIKKINKKFEANPSDDVFLFIPKSIVEQGGEEGGNTEAGEEGQEKEGKEGQEGEAKEGKEGKQGKEGKGKKGKKDGENQTDGGLKGGEEEGGEPSDEEPTDNEDGENQTDGGLKGGEEEQQKEDEESKRVEESEKDGSGGEQEDSDKKSNKPSMKKPFTDFPEAITKLSEISGVQPSTLINVFRTPTLGETWLLTNNFRKIKSELNLPSDMTALELSKSIINSK